MAKVHKFGTFGGVFTPSILTILGVIMYLRLPLIVGEAGLWATLAIIILAHLISVTTGLSISSIATDKKVEAGGTYYMISRSLGLPIGGTLGLALFVGLSFSVSLYLIGFAESFLTYWGFEVSIHTIRIAGTIVLIAVTTLTLISTSLAIKTQYFIMAAIVLSLVSIIFGKHDFKPAISPFVERPGSLIPFMVLFGIFFPAVTGFEAGVSMSGDLKDPKRSIPAGSIIAIVVGLFVYIALAVFFYFTVDSKLLVEDPLVLVKISWLPGLVITGIWGATLSSALGSILGAPRILQATAADKITPRLFSKGVGASNEPRNALILTFLIAEAGILIGDLNVIARIVTIFFITTYGFLNLSCAFETWTSADFRPTFKTPVWISMLGAVACFIVMIELDFVATLGASVLLGALYLYLKRKELSLQTGDAWSGVWSSLVKTSLHRLTASKEHTRNWRPNVLMFNGTDKARPFMLSLGTAITGKLGLLSSFELVQSDNAKLPRIERQTEHSNGVDKTFHHKYVCEDIYQGIDEIIRVYGFAGIEPNTVLMGWSSKPENKEKFIGLMKHIQQYNFNSLFLYHNQLGKSVRNPHIDIWWSGRGSNLALALNIIRHITTSETWQRAEVRLCTILNNPDDRDKVDRFLRGILTDYRTTATIKIIENHLTLLSEQEIVGHESAGAHLSIIGIDSKEDDFESTFHYVGSLCKQLGTALFINASDVFEEYNVFASQGAGTLVKRNEWILPDIEKSKYPEIDVDIAKIDDHGQKLVLSLHNRVFKPSFQLEEDIYIKFRSLTENTAASLANVLKHSQPYQRRVAIERSRKHFIQQAREIIDNAISQVIKEQETQIQEGIQWYLKQIDDDVNRFPKFKSVRHERSEFQAQKSDPGELKWFKFRNKVLRPFSKKPIPIKNKFREGAAYFFRDTRYHFLSMVMYDVEKILSASREKIQNFLSWTDESFYAAMNAPQDESIKLFAKNISDKADILMQDHHESLSRCLGRLQLEFRKNLIFFMHQLERIDFNQTIQKKRRTESFYQKKRRGLSNFPSGWSDAARLEINTIAANVMIYNYFGVAHLHAQTLNLQIAQYIEKQQQKVNELCQMLSGVLATPYGDSKQPVLPDISSEYEYLLGYIREMSEKLLLMAGKITEEINVKVQHKKEAKEFTLPLRAMIIHLTETVLTGPIQSKGENALAKAKRLSLIVGDRARLAIFNLFNLKKGEDPTRSDEEMKMAILSINEESKSLDKIILSIAKEINELCDNLKNALRLPQMVAMSGDFSQLVRQQKTRRLQNRVSKGIFRVRDFLHATFISALYSRSKGILLSRQLSDGETLSVNEKLMLLVNQATPNPEIIQELPHYYVSLFNRRSSIGDNFWIPRPVEENELEEIYRRYRQSKNGMVLVLSEPNAGKSALCKHFGRKKSDSYTVFHIFPPEEGSVEIKDFEETLQKVVGIDGDSKHLFTTIAQDSMIILHDLELWWERSEPHGLDVIHHIRWLIESFSNKCLFVVNTTPFSFSIINTAVSLDVMCAGIVRCTPFNSFELKQLIMTRHNSSGLTLNFVDEEQGLGSQIRLARVFNRLFSYSGGNPGVAMNAWLTGIQQCEDKNLIWKRPVVDDGSVLTEMPDIWGHICFQLLIHNRMSVDKMVRCLQFEKEQIEEITSMMLRLDLITEHSTFVYNLNSNIELFMVNYCKEKEWV